VKPLPSPPRRRGSRERREIGKGDWEIGKRKDLRNE